MRILKNPYFQFPCFLVLGGVLSMIFRYDLLWDFANYHYYNPWAFLNGRLMYDIAPAGVNTFFNPLADIPLYLLIKYLNDYPNIIHFAQGLWLGGLMYISFLIFKLYFNVEKWQGILSVIAALAISMTSWGVYSQIGSSTNEIPIAFFELLAFYILVKAVFFKEDSKSKINKFLLSGFILGAAMGLKLTAVIYCVSIGLTLLCFYRQVPQAKRNIPFFILGGLLGFVTFYGFWGYMLWDKLQNPFFPYANGIFKSDWYLIENYRDLRRVPETVLEYINKIFLFFDEQEVFVVNPHLVFLWVILPFYIIYWMINKFKCQDKQYCFTVVSFIVGYVFWIVLFSILRYTIYLNVLGAIILVKTFTEYGPKKEILKILWSSIAVIGFFIIVTSPQHSSRYGRRTNEDIAQKRSFYYDIKNLKKTEKLGEEIGFEKFAAMQKVNIPDNSLVLIYGRPSAAFLPLAAQTAKVRGLTMTKNSYNGAPDKLVFNSGKWLSLKENIIKNHKGKIIAITAENSLREMVAKYEWKEHNPYIPNIKCRDLGNNMANWSLCFSAEDEKEIFGGI